MNTPTLPHQKTLRFAIEADAALSTLENALAIVRRTGITLEGLRIAPGADGMDVWMRLMAAEDDALTLCRMRLHNVVGILAIREFPRPAAVEAQAVA
jgi:acetolactate synthase regulatory subunit